MILNGDHQEAVSFETQDATFLVGGWTNPSEKYDRQNGNLPQIGLKIKDIWVATTQISVFVLGDSEDATVITNLEDWDPVVNNPLSGSGCGTPFQIA